MRMTNKIMQNNSLYNINNNKLLQDKMSTMMSTQKKITRPSDDPVIAIRALRLRNRACADMWEAMPSFMRRTLRMRKAGWM